MKPIDFRMPRYQEIPDVGLYLEQTVKYINQCIEPLRISITASMLSNYVKKGFVARPIKKQYYADQIAHLIFIAIVKQTLSMQNIVDLFQLQQKTYDAAIAYDYFCSELETRITNLFHEKNDNPISTQMPFEKKALTSVVIAISHTIYLNYCFEEIKDMNERNS